MSAEKIEPNFTIQLTRLSKRFAIASSAWLFMPIAFFEAPPSLASSALGKCSSFFSAQKEKVTFLRTEETVMLKPELAIDSSADNVTSFHADRLALQNRVFASAANGSVDPRLREVSREQISWPAGDSILIVPDSHGEYAAKAAILDILQQTKINFFSLEMIPAKMQPTLDDYANLSRLSSGYQDAIIRLTTHLERHWAYPGLRKKSQRDAPSFDLIAMSRQKKVRVVGLDVLEDDVSFARPESMGYRNLQWALRVPARGRGIVFGGCSHFEEYHGIRRQDFLREQYPSRDIQILR